MIIEFYGLPGSGKTTVAKALVSQGGSGYAYFHTGPRQETLKYAFLFFLRNPAKMLFWVRQVIRESMQYHFRVLFRYKLHLLLISVAQYEKARTEKGSEICVVDEGLYQRILSFYEAGKDRDAILRCMRHMPRPDILVVTKNTKTEFYRFLHSPYRRESPRLHLGEEYFRNWMEVVRENDRVIQRVLKESSFPVIVCDGPDGMDRCLGKIHEAIVYNSKNR